MNEAGLTIGYRSIKGFMPSGLSESKFHGKIAGLNMWSKVLSNQDMIDITGQNQCKDPIELAGVPDVYQWLEGIKEWTSSSPYIKKETINREADVCNKGEAHTTPVLYPVLGTYQDAIMRCESLRGRLIAPKTSHELQEIIDTVVDYQNDTFGNDCDNTAYVGITKQYPEDIFHSYDGSVINYLPFAKDQPNGRDFELCVTIYMFPDGTSYYYDIYCNNLRCPICEIDLFDTVVQFRGQMPEDLQMDRRYGFDALQGSKGLTGFSGFMDTYIKWDNGLWRISNLFVGKSGQNIGHAYKPDIHPMGLAAWNISNQLYYFTMTQCNEDQFTCHKYGNCIPITWRCDGIVDCIGEGDVSDEEHCEIVKVNIDAYNKELVPKEFTFVPAEIEAFIRLDNINYVDELGQELNVQLKIRMKWFDNRLEYKNLKEDRDNNVIEQSKKPLLWVPTLVVFNADEDFLTVIDDKTVLAVEKWDNSSLNSIEEVHEDLIFKGKKNPLVMTRFYTVNLKCVFDLSMFPFDMQKCPLTMGLPGYLRPHCNVQLIKMDALFDNINLNQYDFLGFEEVAKSNTSWSYGKDFTVYMKLRRIFTYHVAATFLPTLCLVLISELTLFIDEGHFEATIMVALTAMLVMYTLFQSVSNTLPQTSYLKMIDIWLLVGLIIPFFIILILVAVDATVINDSIGNNKISPELPTKNKTQKRKSILRWIKLMVPVFTGAFVVGYCIVAARHFKDHV